MVDDDDEMPNAQAEDPNEGKKDFNSWLNLITAQVTMLKITNRIVSQILDDGSDDDEEFEDVEHEVDDKVIDIEKLKVQCLNMLNIAQIIERTEAIPQLIGFSSKADSTIDELQESAFSILTTLLYSSIVQVK